MDISYLGLSSFKLKFSQVNVVTDPFDPKMVGLKFPKASCDFVTVSHQHQDHNYLDGLADYKKVLDGPGEYEIMGVSVLGYPFYHDDQKGEKRGDNTAFIFEFQGLRILHLGDLGHELSSKEMDILGDIDVVMVPVGGVFTINAQKAAELVKSMEPSIVIPMHYKIDGMSSNTFESLDGVDKFLKEVGLPVEKMDKLSFKSGDFGEETKVVVLNQKS